jgi:hypothetical protein
MPRKKKETSLCSAKEGGNVVESKLDETELEGFSHPRFKIHGVVQPGTRTGSSNKADEGRLNPHLLGLGLAVVLAPFGIAVSVVEKLTHQWNQHPVSEAQVGLQHRVAGAEPRT